MNLGPRLAVDAALATPERAAGRSPPAAETCWRGYPGYVADRNGRQWDIARYLLVPQMLLAHDTAPRRAT